MGPRGDEGIDALDACNVTSFQATVLSDFSELEALVPDWDRLWGSDPQATVFSTSGWGRASWRAYGAGRTLCTPVVRDGERVVGILPLAVTRGVLGFLGDPRADYNDFVCDLQVPGDRVLHAALGSLSRASIPWRTGVLRGLRDDSRFLRSLPAAQQGLDLRLHVTSGEGWSALDLRQAGDDPLKDILSSRSLNRHEKELRRFGPLEFRHVEERDEIRSHLPDFFRQHIARRAMAGDRSLFCDPEARSFYEALVDRIDPRATLRFALVTAGGRAIAYHFGFESNGTFLLYKPTFSVDLWSYSPGQVLLKKLFEYVRDRGVGTFDFTIGNEAYKEKFANLTGEVRSIRVDRRTIAGRTRSLAAGTAAAMKRSTPGRRMRAWSARPEGVVRRVKDAIRRGGIPELLRGIVQRSGRMILARDVVLVFAGGRGDAVRPNLPFDLRSGSLEDLAVLHAEHPDFFTQDRLLKARERLKRGDRLHIGTSGDRVVHVVWTRLRKEITDAEIGEDLSVPLEKDSRVIYDAWTDPTARGSGVWATVCSRFAAEGEADGTEQWVYCRRENVASRRGIEKAGYRLRFRLERTRLLGIRTRNRVVQKSIGAPERQPA